MQQQQQQQQQSVYAKLLSDLHSQVNIVDEADRANEDEDDGRHYFSSRIADVHRVLDTIHQQKQQHSDEEYQEVCQLVTVQHLLQNGLAKQHESIRVQLLSVLFSSAAATTGPANHQQLKQIKQAMDYLHDMPSTWTPDHIQEIHRLVTNPTRLTITSVSSSSKPVYPCPWRTSLEIGCARPKQLGPLLDGLIEYVNQMTNLAMHPHLFETTLFPVATVLLSEFLKIRPFQDGNKRVAYLLVNQLFAPYLNVPLCLYRSEKEQERMNQLLHDSQWNHQLLPLMTHLLGCVHHTANTVSYLLM